LNSDNLRLHFVIDASGAYSGGLKFFAEKIYQSAQKSNYDRVTFLSPELEANTSGKGILYRFMGSKNHKIQLLVSLFRALYLKRDPAIRVLSISPSITNLVWRNSLTIQNLNDAQSFMEEVNVSRLIRLYRKLMVKFAIKFASEITTISESAKNSLTEIFSFPNDIHVVKLSGEIEKFRTSNFVDLIVLAHSAHKNADQVLSFLNDEQFIGYRVLILGRFFQPELKTQLNNKGVICYEAEQLDDDSFALLINACNCLVMNSLKGSEGYGLPVAQALFLGKAVVTSGDPALAELGAEEKFVFGTSVDENRQMIHQTLSITNSTEKAPSKRLWLNVWEEYEKFLIK